jgi:hypothetical protein
MLRKNYSLNSKTKKFLFLKEKKSKDSKKVSGRVFFFYLTSLTKINLCHKNTYYSQNEILDY